jgi:predicted permease
VALCAVVLAGAGLFIRTLQDRLRIDLGFPVDGIAMVTVNPGMVGYPDARIQSLARSLTERVRSLPGVESAAAGARVPVRASGTGTFVEVDGYAPRPDEEMRVDYTHITPAYFDALGLAVLSGRDLAESDGTATVAVINEEMARRWWPGRSAVGGTVRFGGANYTVVGITRNTAWQHLDVGGGPFLFAPMLRNPERAPAGQFTVIARAVDELHAAALVPAMARMVEDVDPGLVVTDARTMRAELVMRLAPQRAAALLLSAFGALTLVLAAIGIYGVVAFTVGRRRRDYGVMLALGARPRGVLGLAARQMLAPIALGLAAGVAGAAALARVIGAAVPGVPAADPLSIASAALLLAVTAAAATVIPARRAAGVDPLTAIRSE